MWNPFKPIRVVYYDMSVKYMSKREWKEDCQRTRELILKLKKETPFYNHRGRE